MKQCPECKEVYSDQLLYCMRDGQKLFDIDDDDGEPTVVRPQPIFVDITDPPVVEPIDPKPVVEPLPEPMPVATEGRGVNTVAVLIIGTMIGGILVLATMVAVSILTRQKPPAPVNQVNIPLKPSNTPKPSPTETRSPVPTQAPTVDADSSEKDDADDPRQRDDGLIRRGFNGRVIMTNAVVRAAPSIDSDELAVIGYGEPVKIGKPAGENNPWYRVTTEDGVSGWMHGNTIEFIK